MFWCYLNFANNQKKRMGIKWVEYWMRHLFSIVIFKQLLAFQKKESFKQWCGAVWFLLRLWLRGAGSKNNGSGFKTINKSWTKQLRNILINLFSGETKLSATAGRLVITGKQTYIVNCRAATPRLSLVRYRK